MTRQWKAMVWLVALGLVASVSFADVMSFRQGANSYAGTDDNTLHAGSRADQNAGGYHIGVGKSPWEAAAVRTLLRFDLSALAGSYGTINSVTLKLYADNKAKSGINIYAVKPANADWVEGSKQWATETGASCWNYKAYSTTAWAGSAGCGTADTDYDSVSLATFSTPGPAGIVTIPLTGHSGLTLKDLIDQWSGNQANNAGLLIKADDESSSGDFFASAEALFGVAPELIVDYVAIAATISFQQRGANALVSNYQGTDDAMMYRDRPDSNIGNYAIAIVGRLPWDPYGPGRGLLRFDLSAMAGQYGNINSVTLSLWQDTPTGGDQTIDIYAISGANAGWVEGTKDGNQGASTGECTWNAMNHGMASWAGSAGLGTSGADYESIPLATFNTGSASGWVSIPLAGHTGLTLKDLIEQWSGPQANNAGLLIRNQYEEGSVDKRSWFASTEAVNIWGPAYDFPPKLTINYSFPTPGTVIVIR